jgi:hypothetical protein
MKTSSKYILIFFLTVIICSCRQQKIEVVTDNHSEALLSDSVKFEHYFQWTQHIEYFKSYNYDSSVLLRAEKNRDSLMLLNFLIDNYDGVKLHDDFSYEPADLLDIIYQGPTGGEQNITQIFLNKGDYYIKVFSGYQDVIKADFSNGRLNSFTLINPGCCADPQIVEYYYSVNYTVNIPSFKLDKTIGYLSQTEKPQTQLLTPKGFIVQTNNAKLRSDCYKLDHVEHPVYGDNGNVIANYKSGSKGKTLGIKKDKSVEWIFAIMNSDSKIDSCDFSTFKEQPTEIKGWMLKSDTDFK